MKTTNILYQAFPGANLGVRHCLRCRMLTKCMPQSQWHTNQQYTLFNNFPCTFFRSRHSWTTWGICSWCCNRWGKVPGTWSALHLGKNEKKCRWWTGIDDKTKWHCVLYEMHAPWELLEGLQFIGSAWYWLPGCSNVTVLLSYHLKGGPDNITLWERDCKQDHMSHSVL